MSHHKNHYTSVIFIIIITLFFSCSNDDPSPPSQMACKVQTQSGSGTGRESATVTYTYTYSLGNTYDEKGNQTGSTSSYQYVYSDGKSSVSSSNSASQFDDNGYILRTISQYSGTDKDGKGSSRSSSAEYHYDNNRLTKINYSSTDNGMTKDYSVSYEYDSEGKVTKVSSTYDNSYSKFEYSGTKVQKITRVDAVGNSYSPFIEYNKNGLLVKTIDTQSGTSYEERYEYDSEGQEIRFERYINAKPYDASTYEYDDKENPYMLNPPYKGHPTVPRAQPIYAPKHNLLKSTNFYANSTTGVWEGNGSTIYTYDYNGKNLPVDINSSTLDKMGVQTYSTKTSYVYQNCP